MERYQITNGVFVAGPFTGALGRNGDFNRDLKRRLEFIMDCIESANFTVSSSHVDEKWGSALEEPGILLGRDVNNIRDCTYFVGYFASTISFGSWVELGIALAMHKPILLIIEDGYNIRSDFYQGILDTKSARQVFWRTDAEVKKEITRFLINREVVGKEWIDHVRSS